VEAQHLVATMRLVDTAAEQEVLERMLEGSKPPVPEEARRLDYLLNTPFRYVSPHASRFRPAGQPGVWYGAERIETAGSPHVSNVYEVRRVATRHAPALILCGVKVNQIVERIE